MLRTARIPTLVLFASLAGCGAPSPKVEVTLGDSLFRAEAGATVFIPRDTWIGFRVTGTDTATIVFAFNTPGFEKCLRLLSAPAGTTFVPLPDSTVAAARKACHQVPRRK
jgi:hypothetical protein